MVLGQQLAANFEADAFVGAGDERNGFHGACAHQGGLQT